QAAAGLVRRFIFLSSVKVHGEDSGSGTYSEDDTLDPQDSYGRSKFEAERALTETAARNGIELVIVRPPLVYGPEVKANFLRLPGNLAIDSSRARRLLDWRPPYTLDAGLAETARWFRSART